MQKSILLRRRPRADTRIVVKANQRSQITLETIRASLRLNRDGSDAELHGRRSGPHEAFAKGFVDKIPHQPGDIGKTFDYSRNQSALPANCLRIEIGIHSTEHVG